MGWGDTLFYLISLIRLIFGGGGFAASVASLTLDRLLDRETRTAFPYLRKRCPG